MPELMNVAKLSVKVAKFTHLRKDRKWKRAVYFEVKHYDMKGLLM